MRWFCQGRSFPRRISGIQCKTPTWGNFFWKKKRKGRRCRSLCKLQSFSIPMSSLMWTPPCTSHHIFLPLRLFPPPLSTSWWTSHDDDLMTEEQTLRICRRPLLWGLILALSCSWSACCHQQQLDPRLRLPLLINQSRVRNNVTNSLENIIDDVNVYMWSGN